MVTHHAKNNPLNTLPMKNAQRSLLRGKSCNVPSFICTYLSYLTRAWDTTSSRVGPALMALSTKLRSDDNAIAQMLFSDPLVRSIDGLKSPRTTRGWRSNNAERETISA